MAATAIHQSLSLSTTPAVVEGVANFLNSTDEGPWAQKLINLLHLDPSVKGYYNMCAGVGEGYTVGQHTRMVVESFEKEFQPNDKTQEILKNAGLTHRQFMLFLALHDIGKGMAVAEHNGPSPERKEKELKYSSEIIAHWATALKIEDTCLAIFRGLLIEDEIGEFAVNRRTFEGTLASIKKGAETAELPPRTYLHLKALFHQIDAASYPFVRVRFFQTDAHTKVTLGHVANLPKYVGYSEANQKKITQLEQALSG